MAISVDRFLAIVYPLKVSSEIPYIFIEFNIIKMMSYTLYDTVYDIQYIIYIWGQNMR